MQKRGDKAHLLDGCRGPRDARGRCGCGAARQRAQAASTHGQMLSARQKWPSALAAAASYWMAMLAGQVTGVASILPSNFHRGTLSLKVRGRLQKN